MKRRWAFAAASLISSMLLAPGASVAYVSDATKLTAAQYGIVIGEDCPAGGMVSLFGATEKISCTAIKDAKGKDVGVDYAFTGKDVANAAKNVVQGTILLKDKDGPSDVIEFVAGKNNFVEIKFFSKLHAKSDGAADVATLPSVTPDITLQEVVFGAAVPMITKSKVQNFNLSGQEGAVYEAFKSSKTGAPRNLDGSIAGVDVGGTNANGIEYIFISSPAVEGVPELASWAMAMIGFSLIALRLRRRAPTSS